MTENKRLTNEELAQIAERCEKATEGPWEYIESDNVVIAPETFYAMEVAEDFSNGFDATFIANARQDIPKLLAEIERLDAESWYWRLEYQQMKTDYERSKTKAQRFYNERNYYKGYADRYSDVIKEKDAEIERLKRKLSLIEDKAASPVVNGVDAVSVDLLYEIYLHAKEDEENAKA